MTILKQTNNGVKAWSFYKTFYSQTAKENTTTQCSYGNP